LISPKEPGCGSEIVSDKTDALRDGSGCAGILDINAGKPAGGFVGMDKIYHGESCPPGADWGNFFCCQWLPV